jgi:hypothetical protein
MSKIKHSLSYVDYTDNDKKYLVFTYVDGTEKCFLVDNDSLVEDSLPSSATLITGFNLLS